MEIGAGDGAVSQCQKLAAEGLEADVVQHVPYTDILGVDDRQNGPGADWGGARISQTSPLLQTHRTGSVATSHQIHPTKLLFMCLGDEEWPVASLHWEQRLKLFNILTAHPCQLSLHSPLNLELVPKET